MSIEAIERADTWPNGVTATAPLVSFDGGTEVAATVQRPDRYSFFKPSQNAHAAIARGAGLSFSAASFAEGVDTIDMRQFDRILDFDSTTGEIEVEPGVLLGTLFDFLQQRGFYLPVQPGYPSISVGGCIAGDVHGKNAARDGTFIRQVRALRLFHPLHGITDISPAREPDLFRATCGGFGLTGIILSARLAPSPIAGRAVLATHTHVLNMPDGADVLARVLPDHDFAFGWYDLNIGRRFGRGTVQAFKMVQAPVAKPMAFGGQGITAKQRGRPPAVFFNRWTSRLVSFAYQQSLRRKPRAVDLFTSMFPFYRNEAYFLFYGRPGFHESQVIVPKQRFGEYCDGLRDGLERSGAVVCFSAMKIFKGESDFVRFDGDGISLAIQLTRTPALQPFLETVDRLTLQVGGRPNGLKDSRLPRAVFDASYPDADRFRALIGQWDPQRLFRSAVTTRLGL